MFAIEKDVYLKYKVLDECKIEVWSSNLIHTWNEKKKEKKTVGDDSVLSFEQILFQTLLIKCSGGKKWFLEHPTLCYNQKHRFRWSKK